MTPDSVTEAVLHIVPKRIKSHDRGLKYLSLPDSLPLNADNS